MSFAEHSDLCDLVERQLEYMLALDGAEDRDGSALKPM